MTLPRIVDRLSDKLRTFALTMLTVLTCVDAAAVETDAASATGMTSLGMAALMDHPATLADVRQRMAEAAVAPGPYGLWDLTTAELYVACGDSLRQTAVGLRGMAGRLWYELRSSVGRSWSVADGADVGLAASAGIDGGADLEQRRWLVLTGGLRWHVDSAWTIGVTLTDVLTLGKTPSQERRLTLGLGLQCANGTTVAVDTSVDPIAGFGMLVGARKEVHPRLSIRCAFRSYPTSLTAGLRCAVTTATSVAFDVDFVRDLGSRTRFGVAWIL